MTIYCPTCNRSSDEANFVGEFCEFCISEKIKRKLPQIIKIYQCRFCNKIKVVNTFFNDTASSFGRAVAVGLGIDCKVKVLHRGNDGTVKCVLTCPYQNSKVSFDYEVKVKTLHETCQRCYRISSGYYQAIVQLRGNRIKIERISEKLKRFLEKRGGYITRTEDVENGTDFYISDKEMVNDFLASAELKPERSYRLYGVVNGKEVYRNTYALHL